MFAHMRSMRCRMAGKHDLYMVVHTTLIQLGRSDEVVGRSHGM